MKKRVIGLAISLVILSGVILTGQEDWRARHQSPPRITMSLALPTPRSHVRLFKNGGLVLDTYVDCPPSGHPSRVYAMLAWHTDHFQILDGSNQNRVLLQQPLDKAAQVAYRMVDNLDLYIKDKHGRVMLNPYGVMGTQSGSFNLDTTGKYSNIYTVFLTSDGSLSNASLAEYSQG